jgi:hypothetical protein
MAWRGERVRAGRAGREGGEDEHRTGIAAGEDKLEPTNGSIGNLTLSGFYWTFELNPAHNPNVQNTIVGHPGSGGRQLRIPKAVVSCSSIYFFPWNYNRIPLPELTFRIKLQHGKNPSKFYLNQWDCSLAD